MCQIIGSKYLLSTCQKTIWTCRRDFLTGANALFINVVSNHIIIPLIKLSKRVETGGNTLYVNVPFNCIKIISFWHVNWIKKLLILDMFKRFFNRFKCIVHQCSIKISLIELSKRLETGGNTLYFNVLYNCLFSTC